MPAGNEQGLFNFKRQDLGFSVVNMSTIQTTIYAQSIELDKHTP